MGRNRRALVLAVSALAASAAAAAPAHADVTGLGAGDSLGSPAGPIRTGVSYTGTFKRSDDLDHVLFSVAQGGARVRFTISNTFTGCPRGDPCPIWGTLLDTAGRQLGGEGSQAGTGPVAVGDSERVEWTFPQAGNYILVLEGNGDLSSYRFRADPADGASPAPVTRLTAAGRQRATAARARLTLTPAASSVTASLSASGRPFGRSGRVRVGYLRRGRSGPGAVSLRVPLFAHVRRALVRLGSLRVTLVVTVRRSGSPPVERRTSVLLLAPRR
jgi:hypothetical protein